MIIVSLIERDVPVQMSEERVFARDQISQRFAYPQLMGNDIRVLEHRVALTHCVHSW